MSCSRGFSKTTFGEILPVIDEFEVAFERCVCILDTLKNIEHP